MNISDVNGLLKLRHKGFYTSTVVLREYVQLAKRFRSLNPDILSYIKIRI